MSIDFETFQSAPCDYPTYKYIMDGTISDKWDIKENETILSAIKIYIEKDDEPVLVITNLPASNFTINHGKKIPVCVLGNLSIVDSFDPTGTTVPEPTLTCSCVLNSPTGELSDNQIAQIISLLKNAQLTVKRSFVACNLRDLRDEDGDFKQNVNNVGYFRPVESYQTPNLRRITKASIFGPYLIDDITFDYTKQTLTLDCNLLAYETMKNLLTYEKDSCVLPQYIGWDNEKPIYKYLTCFDPVGEVVAPVDARCNYQKQMNVYSDLNRCLDFNQILAMKLNPEFPCYDITDYFDKYPQRLSPSADKPRIRVFNKLNDLYTFYPLYSYLNNVPYLNCFLESALLNNLYILPTNYSYENSYINQEVTAKIRYLQFKGNNQGVTFEAQEDHSIHVYGSAGKQEDPGAYGGDLYYNTGTYEFKVKGGIKNLVELSVYTYFQNGNEDPTRSFTLSDGNTKTIDIIRGEHIKCYITAGSKTNTTLRDTYITVTSKQKYTNGRFSWKVVGGKKPNKTPFPSEKQTPVALNSLGKYYDTTSDLYFISKNSILTQSDSKQEVKLDNIKYVTTSDIKILEDFVSTKENGNEYVEPANVTTETFSLSLQPTNTKPDVVSSSGRLLGEPGKYGLRGSIPSWSLPSNESVTLPEGKWYDSESSASFLNGANGDAVTFAGRVIDSKATANFNAVASLTEGRTLKNPIGLYNPKLKLMAFNYDVENPNRFKPFSVTLRVVEPTTNKLDRNGKSSAELNENERSLDTKFISQIKHRSALSTVLDRVNAVNMKPLYGLEWTMIDDPFLRIGTIVYYPLNNRYVEVLITEQTRTYSKGGKLQCKGWVLEETDMPVVDNRDKSIVYSGEVKAQTTVIPLMDNHWLRG